VFDTTAAVIMLLSLLGTNRHALLLPLLLCVGPAAHGRSYHLGVMFVEDRLDLDWLLPDYLLVCSTQSAPLFFAHAQLASTKRIESIICST